jgi:hypothetical protein
MFGQIMKIMSGGPNAIRGIAREYTPSILQMLHRYFAEKTTLSDGETLLVSLVPHEDNVMVFALVVHDNGQMRQEHVTLITDLIDQIPDSELKLDNLSGT